MKQPAHEGRAQVEESLKSIKELGYRILDAIEQEDFDRFGRMLDEHWQSKKRLSRKVSLPEIDALYDCVKQEHGVLGGKILGAGGGGFLMLYCGGDPRRLVGFMQRHGYFRLHYNLAFDGAAVVGNFHNSHHVGITHTDGRNGN